MRFQLAPRSMTFYDLATSVDNTLV